MRFASTRVGATRAPVSLAKDTGPGGVVLAQVPRFPCRRVELGERTVRIEGVDLTVDPGTSARDAAVSALVADARALRGPAGAIRAEVTAPGSSTVWHAVVTAGGDLFDATVAAAPRSHRKPAIVDAVVATVVAIAATTTILLITPTAPPPASVAPPAAPPSGTPTPYPQLPPRGFAGQADWSTLVAPGAVPVVTDTAVLVVTGTSGAPAVSDLDPRTGLAVWTAPLPTGAGAGLALHLAVIDGVDIVATATSSELLWWPIHPTDTNATAQAGGRVELPEQALVSWAGSTPMVTTPGQHAAAISGGQLQDRAVPAGATALGATTDASGAVVVVAANTVGQLWRLPAGSTTIPSPTQLVAPPGATTLASVAGYTAPLPTTGTDRTLGTTATSTPALTLTPTAAAASTPTTSGHGSKGGGGDLVVLTWFTADPDTRLVTLTDASTAAPTAAALTVSSDDLANVGWISSPRHQLGALGKVLARTAATTTAVGDGVGLVLLPAGWRTTEVIDSALYGTAPTAAGGGGGTPSRLVTDRTGQTTALGSGTTPLGISGTRAVVAATIGSDTTLYGLPTASAAATPTPSVTVPFGPQLPPAAPTPSALSTPAP